MILSSASVLVLAVALSAGPAAPPNAEGAPSPSQPSDVSLRSASTSFKEPARKDARAELPRWLTRDPGRPAALPAMYATLGALHALDVYSTRRAMNAGAKELNPAMRRAAGHAGAMLAVKALSTAGSIYFTERAWKKNRKGAVILMAVVNGVTAAVVANNLRTAR